MRSCRAMTFSTVLSLIILASAASVLVSGCGSSSSSNTPVVLSTPQSTYLVEYIPGMDMSGAMTDATIGKTMFQIRVREIVSSGTTTPAAGLADSIKLVPIMHMSDGGEHGTPVDVVQESSTAGTYDCTVYYLMASGSGMGYWELQVKIGSETATFYPTVDMAMGSDTVKATMQSMADMSNNKKYYLFNDGMVTAAMPTFLLYISRAENNPPTVFTPISAVSGPSGTVSSVLVTVSTDASFPSTTGVTVTASDDGNGHFSMPMSALSTTGTYTVFVKMAVDGDVKTSDGLATNASGTNLYLSFKVTSH